MNTDIKGLKKLMEDESFVKELVQMEEPEQAQAAFKAKGFDFTREEMIQIGEQVNKYLSNELKLDELDLDQLDEVSGGVAGMLMLSGAVIAMSIAGAAGGGAILAGLIITIIKFRW